MKIVLLVLLLMLLMGSASAWDDYVFDLGYSSWENNFYSNMWTIYDWGWTSNSWYDTGSWYNDWW